MRQMRASGVFTIDLMRDYSLSKASAFRLLSGEKQPKEGASAT
jgi:hypothetical protein